MNTNKKTNEMGLDTTFFISAFDALREQVAIINKSAEILFVNKAWKRFGEENNGKKSISWIGKNYLNACSEGSDETNNPLIYIKNGIEQVINGEKDEFITEYPCDSPSKRRWFCMRIALLGEFSPPLYLISHYDISERKKLEEEALKLSLRDNLTNLSNRKHFLDVVLKEWNRSLCSNKSLACIMIDVDAFSNHNETYGHLIADECLSQLGMLINDHCRNELDLAARFGGDEFALLLVDSSEDNAFNVAESIRSKVMDFKFPNYLNDLTISCGVTSIKPATLQKVHDLTNQAMSALNLAKENGGNKSVRFTIIDE